MSMCNNIRDVWMLCDLVAEFHVILPQFLLLCLVGLFKTVSLIEFDTVLLFWLVFSDLLKSSSF